ncbi:MAG: glutamate--tRNA ligase [Pseudomonadota bacterium]
MSVITRFPPSPTGMMHIGNARTALFNWLYARHSDGKFVIRIEDTDRARHSEEAVQVIMDSLEWLELNFDNTPESQFANRQRHIDVANELLAAGKAYKCYCTPEELTEMREESKKVGRPVAYDNRWRDKSEEDAPADAPFVIRIKSPLGGHAVVNDKVQGEVQIANDHIDDFVLLRADGTPTYMLAVVVDDHDMGITHVMRGDDHLNNTFRQNVIYDQMGWDKPTYAHLPLIHGPDGSKFSKRHGAVGVGEFKELGYLPEAMRNYLLRLGWSHGDEEIMDMKRAIEIFDFDGMQKSPANFDYQKLESLNAHYMKESDNARLVELVAPFLSKEHGVELNADTKAVLLQGMDGLKDRSKTLVELATEGLFYVQDIADYNEKAQKQLTTDSLPVIVGLKDALSNIASFRHEEIEKTCRDYANDKMDGKLGKVMMPLRAALTGTDKSPSLFEAAEVLGQETVTTRLQNAINYIESK